MKLNYFLLDVFTDRQFGGNPLAVFPNADVLTDRQMQSIAQELNLSESTFIQKATSEAADCTVRIFTPRHEMPMAGHPTIGTAWAILKYGLLSPQSEQSLLFDEGVGAVAVDYSLENSQPRDLVMHQPLPEFGKTLDRVPVAELLSLQPDDLEGEYPVQIVSCGVPMVLVPLKTLDAARRAIVRLDLLDSTLADVASRELFVFTRETENANADVHCRLYAPRLGVPEDPATGSAHGPLGSYLVKYGLSDGARIVGEQGIEMGRPSTIKVCIKSSGDSITDVLVGGECVEVGQGTINLA